MLETLFQQMLACHFTYSTVNSSVSHVLLMKYVEFQTIMSLTKCATDIPLGSEVTRKVAGYPTT